MSAEERAAKTAMSCSAPSGSKNCASTGVGCGEKPATGSFPATVGILRITRSTQKRYTTPAKEPRSARVLTVPSIPTPCATIWTSRLCRVEDESVQLNELLLQALIDWADLATRHSPAALYALQKS